MGEAEVEKVGVISMQFSDRPDEYVGYTFLKMLGLMDFLPIFFWFHTVAASGMSARGLIA